MLGFLRAASAVLFVIPPSRASSRFKIPSTKTLFWPSAIKTFGNSQQIAVYLHGRAEPRSNFRIIDELIIFNRLLLRLTKQRIAAQ
jgi:hypothetical protein